MDSLCIPMNVFCHTHQRLFSTGCRTKKPSVGPNASHARSAAVDNLGTWKDTDSSWKTIGRKIEGEKNLLHIDEIWWMLWRLFFFVHCVEICLMLLYQNGCKSGGS